MAAPATTERTLRTPTIAGAIGWGFALLGFAFGSRPLFDNSFFTHLATGRLILETGIPREDPYSFTAAGEPWVVQSWLVSLVYGGVERLAGPVGVRVVGGLLVAALVALVWFLTRPAEAMLARVLVLAVFLVGAGPFLSPRPLLVGLVLFALALVVVTEGHDPRWLVPLFWVWVNSHGSFPLGVAAVGCLAVGAWLDGDRSRDPWRTVAWAVAGTLAGAISPVGPVLLLFPLQVLGRMEVLQHVIEWQSPSFADGFARAFLLQVLVAVVVLVRRPSYRVAVPLVVFLAAALTGQRNIPLAALALLPGLAAGVIVRAGLRGTERTPAGAIVAVGLTIAAAAIVVPSLGQPSFDLASYPTRALAVLDERGVLGSDARVVSSDDTGNLRTLLDGTGAQVFFDDRYDMYPLEVSRDYRELNAGTGRWEEVLERHRVEYLVWGRPSPLAGLVASSPRWKVVYQDPTAIVACSRDARASRC